MLGLAFPPNFRETGFFFVNYTDRNGDTVVSRFHVDPGTNRADAGSESRVLFVDQPAANHNGGNLVFGPDGMLWIGMGDGGGAGDRFGNAQNPASLLGKILRIDVTSDTSKPYTIPADNPWVSQQWNGRKMVPEAWSLGMRNPWRFSFDPQTKALWIADVGQNAYEEINRIDSGPNGYPQGGLNFGWPVMEGTHCYPASAQCRSDGLVMPVFDYARTSPRCSITGGYVYRGAQFPALNGVYLFSDYCSGEIWALAQGAGGRYQASLLLDSPYFVSSFGRDDAGELYVTDLSGGGVYRVVVR